MLDNLPRGVRSRGLLDGQSLPFASWKDPAALLGDARYAFDGTRLFLGQLMGRFIGIRDDRHALLVAGTRAGKGRSIIVPTLLTYEGSVLAIDPKAELASITARHRSIGLGQRIYVLDPYRRCNGYGEAHRAYFNPLEGLTDRETMIEDAALIADALIIVAGRDPHWDESARELFRGLILYIVQHEAGAKSLVRLRDILRDTDELHRVLTAMEALATADIDEIDAAIKAVASTMIDKPDKERDTVFSTARRQTEFLDYPGMRDVLAPGKYEHTFALDDLKTAPGGMTVYLCLPAGRLGICSRWLRLFVNLSLEAMERSAAQPKCPVLFCLEEFATLGPMKQIQDAAGQMAGFGVRLLIVLQDLAQLKELYKARWETFIGNSGTLLFFANNDLATLDFVSKRLGTTSLLVSQTNAVSYEAAAKGERGVSASIKTQELLTPEEFSRYFGRGTNRLLVIHAGDDPIAIELVKYDLHVYFTGRWDRWEKPSLPKLSP